MRLLGWMHNKPRQSHIEAFKEFTLGPNSSQHPSSGNYFTCLSAQSPIDDHVSYARPSFVSKFDSGSLTQQKGECEKTFPETEAKGMGNNYDDETSKIISEFFHGFLAVGTLGSESITSVPATPAFSTSLENLTEEKEEVTANDLKLINEELEKFLETEAEEEGGNESMARSSYVSTITLSGMHMMEANAEDCENAALCPLQGYLFGSSIELPETRIELKKEKVSLGEMFRMTKVTDEISTNIEGKGVMPAKQAHKSAKNIVKKILKKFHAPSGNPTPTSSDNAANVASTKKKLNKVLKMFHRKVHPENSIANKEFTKSHKEKTRTTLQDDGYSSDLMHLNEGNKKFVPGSKSMQGSLYYKKLKLPQNGLSGSNFRGIGEHWIKTDADYLVLEL